MSASIALALSTVCLFVLHCLLHCVHTHLLQVAIHVESVDEQKIYGTGELDFCAVLAEEVQFAA